MRRYIVWIRLNPSQTAHVVVLAENDLLAKLVAEAQYGVGSVLGWHEDRQSE